MSDIYLKPFITASVDMIEQIAGLKLGIGEVFSKDTSSQNDSLLVLIGVTGGFHGNIGIAFDKEICCRIASAMMGCGQLNDIDEMAMSAIGELCNMMLGSAATMLSKEKIIIDITPPAFLIGDNVKFSTPNPVICIPLLFEGETIIELNISFAEL